jgi:hypothetical protein
MWLLDQIDPGFHTVDILPSAGAEERSRALEELARVSEPMGWAAARGVE